MATQINFEEELRKLINAFSLEPHSNTPDYMLARYIIRCIETWETTIKERDKWYGFIPFDNFPENIHHIKL